MYRIFKFILAIVGFVVMPFRLWFLKKPDHTQKISSSRPTANDNEE